MIILMILSMVGFKGEYLKIRQVSQNPTLRLSLLKPEQNQTSYLMENNYSESFGVKTKKGNKLKYVALETAGGMIGGSIAALGTYFYIKSRDYSDDPWGLSETFKELEILIGTIYSYYPGSLLGNYFTAKALKEKGSLIGAILGEFFIGIGTWVACNFVLNRLSIDPESNVVPAVSLSVYFISTSIGGAIGYNYKTLL